MFNVEILPITSIKKGKKGQELTTVSSGGRERPAKFNWCFLTSKNYSKIQGTAEAYTLIGIRATLYYALLFPSLALKYDTSQICQLSVLYCKY